jgi:hypothetical protein
LTRNTKTSKMIFEITIDRNSNEVGRRDQSFISYSNLNKLTCKLLVKRQQKIGIIPCDKFKEYITKYK